MTHAFHPEAELEFLEAINYSEARKEKLGYEFALEIYATIERIIAHPRAWPALEGEVRRCQTHRFPYAVLYSQEPEGSYILAIMHLHREPGYWKQRRA